MIVAEREPGTLMAPWRARLPRSAIVTLSNWNGLARSRGSTSQHLGKSSTSAGGGLSRTPSGSRTRSGSLACVATCRASVEAPTPSGHRGAIRSACRKARLSVLRILDSGRRGSPKQPPVRSAVPASPNRACADRTTQLPPRARYTFAPWLRLLRMHARADLTGPIDRTNRLRQRHARAPADDPGGRSLTGRRAVRGLTRIRGRVAVRGSAWDRISSSGLEPDEPVARANRAAHPPSTVLRRHAPVARTDHWS